MAVYVFFVRAMPAKAGSWYVSLCVAGSKRYTFIKKIRTYFTFRTSEGTEVSPSPLFNQLSLETIPEQMEFRENLGRLGFIAFLMLLYLSLFFLPQLSELI